MRPRSMLIAITLSLLVPSAADAGVPSACDAAKLRCIEAKTECLLRVYRRALRNGTPVDRFAIARCQERFEHPTRGCIARAVADQKPGNPETLCSVTGDAAALEATVDRCIGAFAAGAGGWKRVFVTSTTYTADFGTSGGALAGDAICQQHASAAQLGGTWMAWTSDGATSPSTRFTRSPRPYVLLNGVIVADDWADLTDGELRAAIDLDERGAPGPEAEGTRYDGTADQTIVWTGTNTDGTTAGAPSCLGWSTTGDGSTPLPLVWGFRLPPGAFGGFLPWTGTLSVDVDACIGTAPLYCFEQ